MEQKQRGHPSIRNAKGPTWAEIGGTLAKQYGTSALEMLMGVVTGPQRAMRGEMSIFNPNGDISDEAIQWAADTAGTVTLGSGAMPAQANTLRAGATIRTAPDLPVKQAVQGGVRTAPDPAGIKAYHGSPHDFDKFQMDKIGTGEGAQAYGHGLYFADSEDVARGYRDQLTRHNAGYRAKMADRRNRSADPEEVRALNEWLDRPDVKGRMYEVNIKANPDDFLDWDKPLSDQPAKVRGALQVSDQSGEWANVKDKYGVPVETRVSGDGQIATITPSENGRYFTARVKPPNGNFYESTVNTLDEGRAFADRYQRPGGRNASNWVQGNENRLREAGVPGVKYFDAGSRNAGDGSRNYVVFDDSLIEIVRKYGIAGAIAAGLLTEQQAQQIADDAQFNEQWLAGNAT